MERTRSELRHSIRGRLNALKLCVFALEMPLATSEKLQFLSDIEFSAERLAEESLELENLPEEPADAENEGSAADAKGGGHVR